MVLISITDALRGIVVEEVLIYVTDSYMNVTNAHMERIVRKIILYQSLGHSKSCADVNALDDFGLLDYDIDIVRKYIGGCMQCYLSETIGLDN